MRTHLWRATVVATAILAGCRLGAQTPADSLVRRQQRALDSLAAELRSLGVRIAVLERMKATGDTSVVDELAALRAAAAAAATDSAAASRPQAARLGQNALNPEISVTGDIRAHGRRPGPQTDTYSAREFEVAFQSALDPFSSAKVFLSVEDGEVAVEEGYAYFTSLPAHLRLDVGRFRQQVGELNRWHLHALPEDEYPLVLRRFGGEDGLSAPGVSLYWPLPFSGARGAYELTVQATTGTSDILDAGGRRPSYNMQLAGFWQLSRSTYAQVSASGLYAANPDSSLTSRLGVAAARFSWRPPQQAQARELTLRSEVWFLKRTFDLPGDEYFDRGRTGGYVDGSWKLDRRWIASVRGDYVESPDRGPVDHEWAVTPTLTFWPSEFVYVRGLYERSRDLARATRDRFTLQLVFAMGPHKHELF
ncbi:MAG: hypothetical protein MNPFHGCM_02969 [Gemmatimonadaceae bacterium]|nr:hypothetical protein [Gemmatimonadaceae bacterium]